MDFRKCVRNCLNPSHTNAMRGQLQADFEHESTARVMKRNTRSYW